MNAGRQFNITTKAKEKKMEKLSSGYRINRAGDDAAGLSISEKMRRQIRGLEVGTENAQDGVSWVQIGEGALNEAHDIMQRMSQLTIKSMNGTNTLTDRAYMEAEFEQLQSELDRISKTTTFNELNIFREHEPIYHQLCGNRKWDYEEIHEVVDGKNQLVINYRDTADSEVKTVTLKVPPGKYTTHELIDELDDAAGILGPAHVEFTEKGFCNVNLEGKEVIETVSGGLTYLLYDMYDGGGYGALIGTTRFPDETSKLLEIVKDQNDKMEFTLEYFDNDKTETVKLDLFDAYKKKFGSAPVGNKMRLSKLDLMEMIDSAVSEESGLKTSHYGDSIMLSSEKGIITGFMGNMFKIENTDPIYTSVFYDNIQHGYVWHDPASVEGGYVLTSDTRDEEHNRYYIETGVNDTLTLQPNLMKTATEIVLDEHIVNGENVGYTAAEMAKHLNDKFKAAGIDGEVVAYEIKSKSKEKVGDDSVYFYGVGIKTVKEGPDSIVNINKNESSAYDTLFTIKDFNSYGTDAKVENETRADKNAYAEGSKNYSGGKTVKITNGKNDSFTITLSSSTANSNTSDFKKSYVIDILGSGSQTWNVTQLASQINTAIGKNNELKDRIEAKVVNTTNINGTAVQTIQIVDKEDKTLDNVNDSYLNWWTNIQISSNGGNNGYRDIFQQSYQYEVAYTSSGKGSLTIDTKDGKVDGSGMWVYINGQPEYLDFKGQTTVSGAVTAINKATPIRFSTASDVGTTQTRSFTASGSGTTGVSYWEGGSAKGTSETKQGIAGFWKNAPAQLEFGPELVSSMKVDKQNLHNNTITIALNGRRETLELADGTYNQEQLADALQNAINAKFGTGMGGAIVDYDSSSKRLVLTSRLPTGEDGKDTSIQAYAQGAASNSFFDYLNKVETAASCTSNLRLPSSVTLHDDDGSGNDKFKFTYTDSTGSHNVEIDVSDSTAAAGETISIDTLISRINNGMGSHKVKASKDGYNRLVLTTTEKGSHTSIRYTTGPSSSLDPNADAIFGGLSTPTKAQIILDKNVKTSASYAGTKTFKFELDGNEETVNIAKWTSANDLANKLNTQFTTKGLDVTASIVNNKLCLTKKTAGSGSLRMTYAGGGTVMGDMFGYEPKPGIKVTKDSTNKKITISAGANDRISVSYGDSGGALPPKYATGYYTHQASGGFHSAKYSTVTSVALNANGVVLDKWNNDLEFSFKQGTKTTKVELKLTESTGNTPTALTDIVKELQEKIDAKLGADVIKVSLDNNKIVMKSTKPGSEFGFSGMQSNSGGKIGGGFFHHVMCSYQKKESKLPDRTDVNGEQWADKIFAQGRHDVVTKLTKIRPGVSDTLVLDLNYIPDLNHDNIIEPANQQKLTLEVKLDANMREEDFYDADKLTEMIQRKLDETIASTEVQAEVEKLGIQLHPGVIEVDVGRHDTQIYGNKDAVSISFTMTEDHDIATPAEGYFYIDGIRGNAAYETFYYTEGEMIPAYIIGTKDINDGVTLGEGETDLSFVVDGKDFTVKLDQGKYTAEQLVDAITQKFEEQDIPLAAEVTKKGVLKISHKKMGTHMIEKVSGGARDKLFYQEYAESKPFEERYVRISSFEGDRVELYSPRFSTTMLNINSICISKPEYAEKALNRLKEAINKVSEIRSTFGSIQNRLEHAINNNRNKHENLQAAESRIRDTDIATEMTEFSNLNIIQQAGQSVLAQANQGRDGLLALLT